MPPLSYSKGTVSFQFAACAAVLCMLPLGHCDAHYYIFTQANFCAQLYDKGHNGITHLECTGVQLKVRRGTPYRKKKKMLWLKCLTLHIQSRTPEENLFQVSTLFSFACESFAHLKDLRTRRAYSGVVSQNIKTLSIVEQRGQRRAQHICQLGPHLIISRHIPEHSL